MSEPFATFGGIDFSGAREPLSNLWTAVGHPAGERLRIVSVRPHAFRSDLAGFVVEGWREMGEGRILWGADFPFGLPSEVAGAIGARNWEDAVAWVADRPPEEVREAAGGAVRTPRLTDGAGAMAPLDLRIFKQTVEGMRWIQTVREATQVSIHPSGVIPDAPVTLIEVYPSLTVRDLGLPRRRSPGRPGEARARSAALRPYLDFADRDIEAAVVTLEDAWDATIACLGAFLCRADLEQANRVEPRSLDRVALEGWIYRPPAALATPG